ncbi:hypothetical protein [Helicobacter cetorum]|uniref:hypothetical protein n=1 Tax=Helicobacter cetorum TaxID=138563 RepID=UPI001F45B770|nr:hypothetical protein [Helicobacter cetorum]
MNNNFKDLETQEKIKKRKKSSQIFWGTIIVLLIVYVIAKVIAYSEPSEDVKTAKTKEIAKYIEKLLPTDKMKDNINQHQAEINTDLNNDIQQINSVIDTQIDEFFNGVENNVDKFLDWHYSLKGDYGELILTLGAKSGLSAEDKLANILQEKLLGSDYKQRLDAITKGFANTYESLLKEHKEFVNNIATQGIDTNISQNAEILNTLSEKIERKIKTDFIGATIGMSSLAIMAKLAPKLMLKISSKLGGKLGAKFLAKLSTALSGSLTCGIAAPVCALGFWFGSDAIINLFDEWFHRDKFKQEILSNIKEVKGNLKNAYKQQYNDSTINFSQKIQNAFKNTQVLEKRTIKEHVENLNQNTLKENENN